MVIAAANANLAVTIPLPILMGAILYLLLSNPRSPKMLTVVAAVLFGAAASATVLAIFNGLASVFHKG